MSAISAPAPSNAEPAAAATPATAPAAGGAAGAEQWAAAAGTRGDGASAAAAACNLGDGALSAGAAGLPLPAPPLPAGGCCCRATYSDSLRCTLCSARPGDVAALRGPGAGLAAIDPAAARCGRPTLPGRLPPPPPNGAGASGGGTAP